MAGTENSLFNRAKKWLIRRWKSVCSIIGNVFHRILQTPLTHYIELLEGLKEDSATISGIALGALVYVTSQTKSDFILGLVVAVIFYIVYKGHENKGNGSHTCPTCNEDFETHHGLKIHTGKKH